jgi:molybdopterin converting factor subunit 1
MTSGAIAVKVRLFATLRQQAGWSEQMIHAPSGSTLGDLFALLMQATPGLKLAGRAVYAAVNQSYAKMDRVLQEGDEVAIFPPVSGGARKVTGTTMSERKRFEITTAPLSLDDVASRVSDPRYGAITTFAGVVRGETVNAPSWRWLF